MEERYLTPNLYIKNNNTYYHNDETHKIEKVTVKNWHKYLIEYGWEKIDNGWIRRLNKYKKDINSRWGILDCGGDGDCLYHVIAEAIGEPDMLGIRKMAANAITDSNFKDIIECYRLAYDVNEFIGEWNPHDIKTKDDLKKEIMKPGNNYWGDHIIIQLLEDTLSLNFIILNSEKLDENYNKISGNLKKRFNIHSIGYNYNPNRDTIILYYIDSCHFKLVGYFMDNYMCTLFKTIPEELWAIYREDCCRV